MKGLECCADVGRSLVMAAIEVFKNFQEVVYLRPN